MYVHRSNRAEALVEALAEVVAQPVAGAAVPECIVVQGRGMERWLSMELARRLGVWANPDFPFPRHLIVRALVTVLGVDEVAASCFEPERLMWSVIDLLPRFLARPEFVPIRAYLAGDAGGIRRVQLGERIARTFDQYVVYRPQMVLAWEGGAGTHWQALLWRALVERHGSYHIAARAREFLRVLEQRAAPLGGFPRRVSVFGISALPPLYLEMLAALSRSVELHLFLLSPSSEYWAEIRSQREVLRALAQRRAETGDIEATLHLEAGNPLLASLGRLGRDFQHVLEGAADYQESDRNLYADPGTATMLATLQSDILALRHRGSGSADAPPLPLAASDDSIIIHACHGPMREVEVLHDQLLALFDADRSLEPRDVVVMSPAIGAYAPFIDAVFGGAEQQRIPYCIADRAVRATDDVVNALLTVLTTLRGRMTANQVLDLLALEPIAQRFGFVAEDLDILRAWIKGSGIRWGVDAAHRQRAELPPLAHNTWRFGLDRLLLGYALPGNGRRLFGGVLPYDDVEGTTAELLGRLIEFCEALFAFHDWVAAPRPLDVWRDELGRLLRTLVASTNQTAHQHRQINAALAELAEHARAAGFHDAVDLDVVQQQLAEALERSAPGRGFLTGGVTFCALVPMRSIPFRVGCLLGMNDADFPRVRRPLGFDLMAQQPMPGDRSSRDDDRYLFLESLLSARKHFIITYVGQSIRDNSEIPPAVVVSELLDAIEESFCNEAVRQPLVLRHPLQPFSRRYFGADPDPRLFSYARNSYEGARALAEQRVEAPPFLSALLPDDRAAKRAVTLDALARFFENSTRAFLQERLGLYLGTDVETLDDREPLELDALERWKLGGDLLERALQGERLADALASVRASGALPPGALGTCVFGDLDLEATEVAANASALMRGEQLQPLVIDAELTGTRITGVIRNLWPAGHVGYQFSRLGGRHELGMWIRHLVLNWIHPHGHPLTSFLIGRHKDGSATVRFSPVENASDILGDLLRLYWLGQTAPLPLFEQASRTYVELLCHPRRPRSPAEALKRARVVFDGDDYNRGDRRDDYVRQVFGAINPLDPGSSLGGAAPSNVSDTGSSFPSFASVAISVFKPMLEHREELK